MIGPPDADASPRCIPSNPVRKRAASTQGNTAENTSHVSLKKITWCALKILRGFVLTDLLRMTFWQKKDSHIAGE